MKQDLKYPIAKDKITNKLAKEVLNGKIVIVYAITATKI
jgi:hypothetical protein